jgi:hypothetical protein
MTPTFTILALICLPGQDPRECLPQTARDNYILESHVGQMECLRHSQMMDGSVNFGLAPGEYHKYMCIKE